MADFEVNRITIIGLGLIGGSLGLALKASGRRDLEVIGHDRERAVEVRAAQVGAIDRGEHNLPRAVERSHLVIIATPILAIREVMEQVAPYLPEGCIVSDTGSTKALVMQWAEELLPPTVHFIGGHPMAGRERQGIDQAEAGLFADSAYVVIPSLPADEGAVGALLGIIGLIGAHPLFLDASEHDRYVAAISHLPLILSASLFTLVRSSPAWPDLAALAASAFRDLTRLASGDPQMSRDICLTNRDAILHWIDRMAAELQRYRQLVAGDDEELLRLFVQAQADRDEFLAKGPPARPSGRQPPDIRQEITSSLLGGALVQRMRSLRRMREKGQGR